MAKISEQGGYAFPSTAPVRYEGMTLRDWFAGQALAGILDGSVSGERATTQSARIAYQIADKMLESREEEVS